MTDVKSLLEIIHGDDKVKGWAAVKTLANMRPSTEEESKAKAFALCCMAEASFFKNKIGTAVDCFQDAVFNDPLNPIYRLSLCARGLMPLGLNKQALIEVNRALRLDNKNPDAWRLLGHIQQELKDTKAAVAAFDKQIELAPESSYSYLDRTDIALDLTDWDTVEKYANKLIEMGGPQKGNALHQLGLMMFRQGRLEEALKMWDEALTYGAIDNPEVVVWNQSIALLALGKYREGWRKHEIRGTQKRDPAIAIQTHRSMPELLFNNEPPPARTPCFSGNGIWRCPGDGALSAVIGSKGL